MTDGWRKEGGQTIDHGGGFVSHEVDPDKLPQEIKDALARADEGPAVLLDLPEQ